MGKVIYLFLLPPVVFTSLFVLYPLFQVFWYSFTNWDGFTNANFVGLANFKGLFADPVFFISLQNNFVWVLIFLALVNGIGLLFAGGIDVLAKRKHEIFRILLYVTALLPSVVVSYLFLALYDPNIGLIDAIFRSIGAKQLASIGWLANPSLALFSVLASSIWQYIPFPMLIFLAAFIGVPKSVYESAKLDGASEWRIFWSIKVPMIRPVIAALLVLTWIWNSMPFSAIWTMTQGGPGDATSVLVTYMYQVAFFGFRFGYGSAIAVVLFVLIFPASIIFFRLFER